MDVQFNKTILQCVMPYLPFKDLLNCRLVCQEWIQSATEAISKKSIICFNSNNIHDSKKGLRPFITTMTSKQIPCIQRIHFFNVNLKDAIVVAFFHVYGRFITHLRLQDKIEKEICYTQFFPYRASTLNGITIQDVKILLMGFLPNLKTLELLDVCGFHQTDVVFIPWHREQMTKSGFRRVGKRHFKTIEMNSSQRGLFSNLTSLRINSLTKTSINLEFVQDIIWASDVIKELQFGDGGFDIDPTLTFLSNFERFVYIKVLKLPVLTIKHLQLLNAASYYKHLELKQFNCQLLAQHLTNSFRHEFLRFLRLQKNNLCLLTLNENSACPLKLNCVGDNSLKMSKLVDLKIIPPLHQSISSFLKFAPNVKVLSLPGLNTCEISDTIWKQLFPCVEQNGVVETIVNLELPLGFAQHERLADLAFSFPNVKGLIVKGLVCINVHVKLWTAWPLLENLSLQISTDFKNSTDFIFIGEENCCIMKLEKLRCLEIYMSDELAEKTYSMTNITLEALSHMNLKTLLLPTSKIEKQCQEKCINQMKLDRYNFNYIPLK